MTGTIKTKLNGFGFITREGEKQDLFFHASNLVGVSFDDLQLNETVTFEITKTDRGDAAINVARA